VNLEAARVLIPQLSTLNWMIEVARQAMIAARLRYLPVATEDSQFVGIRTPKWGTSHLRLLRLTDARIVRLTVDGREERGAHRLDELRRIVLSDSFGATYAQQQTAAAVQAAFAPGGIASASAAP
jgi:hypothetical protein